MALFSRKKKDPASAPHIDPDVGTARSIGTAVSVHSNSASAPAPYVVKSGDTLSAIAEAHGMSLSQLERDNPQISNPNLIQPGEKIYLSRRTETETLTTVLGSGGSDAGGTPTSTGGAPVSGPAHPNPEEHHEHHEHHERHEHSGATGAGGSGNNDPFFGSFSEKNGKLYYKVRPGETLAEVSATVSGDGGPSERRIEELNHLAPGQHLRAGQELELGPGSVSHGNGGDGAVLEWGAPSTGGAPVSGPAHPNPEEHHEHHERHERHEEHPEHHPATGGAPVPSGPPTQQPTTEHHEKHERHERHGEHPGSGAGGTGSGGAPVSGPAHPNPEEHHEHHEHHERHEEHPEHHPATGGAPVAPPEHQPTTEHHDPSKHSGGGSSGSGGGSDPANPNQAEIEHLQSEAKQEDSQAAQLDSEAHNLEDQAISLHVKAHSDGAAKVGAENHLKELEGELADAKQHHKAGTVADLNSEIRRVTANVDKYQDEQNKLNAEAAGIEQHAAQDIATASLDRQAAEQDRQQAGTLKIDHASGGASAPGDQPSDPATTAAPAAGSSDPTDPSTSDPSTSDPASGGDPNVAGGDPSQGNDPSSQGTDPSASGGDPAQAQQLQEEAAQFQTQADQFTAQANQDQQTYSQDVATAQQDRSQAAQDLAQVNGLQADAQVQQSQSDYWHDLAHTAGANKVGSLNHLKALEDQLNTAESHHQAGAVSELKGEINTAADNANKYQAKQDQYNSAASMFDNRINADNSQIAQDQQAAAALNSQADQLSTQATQDQQAAAQAQSAAAEFQSKADQANQQASGFLTSSSYNNLPGTQASEVHTTNSVAGGGTIGVPPATSPESALADPNQKH